MCVHIKNPFRLLDTDKNHLDMKLHQTTCVDWRSEQERVDVDTQYPLCTPLRAYSSLRHSTFLDAGTFRPSYRNRQYAPIIVYCKQSRYCTERVLEGILSNTTGLGNNKAIFTTLKAIKSRWHAYRR